MAQKPKTQRKDVGETATGGGGENGSGKGVSAATLANLHADYSRKLNQLAATVQERVAQFFADYRRALGEAQMSVQSQQESAMRDYVARMQRATPQTSQSEVADSGRAYQDACQAAQKAGQALADDAAKGLQAAVDNCIGDANREWDATIARYIAALQQAVAQLPAEQIDPAALAALGQSFAWVSRQVNAGGTGSKPQ